MGSAPGTVRLATHAMGTRFECVLLGEDAGFLRAAGEETLAIIEDQHRRLNRFERGGPVWEVNALAGVGGVRVDDELFELLVRCEAYQAASGGAFAVARRVSPGGVEAGGDASLLRLDSHARSVSLVHAGTMLDLGGIAKGFALDLAGEALRRAGVRAGLVHGGGSTIVAIGAPPGERGWGVELGGTGWRGTRPIARLRDRAVSVSSQSGDRPGHVIDPATGSAGRGRWAACIGESAEATDAWSTALIVLGGRTSCVPPGLTVVQHRDDLPTLARPGLGPVGPDWVASGPDAGLIECSGACD